MLEQIQEESTLLAFDYGKKRIGVAIGNTITRTARSLSTIVNQHATLLNKNPLYFKKISDLIKEWNPLNLIVGLPFYPNEKTHELSSEIHTFAKHLTDTFALPVIFVDESYSSVEAAISIENQTLFKHQDIDAQAACIILQQFFDT